MEVGHEQNMFKFPMLRTARPLGLGRRILGTKLWMWGQSGYSIFHPVDHYGWLVWSDWLDGCPHPPSPLHVHPSPSDMLNQRGWLSLIAKGLPLAGSSMHKQLHASGGTLKQALKELDFPSTALEPHGKHSAFRGSVFGLLLFTESFLCWGQK